MSSPALSADAISRTARLLYPRSWLLLLGAATLALAAWQSGGGKPAIILGTIGLTMASMALIIRVLGWRQMRRAALFEGQIARFVDLDASPSFTTDATGEILHQNRAALERFGSRGGQALTRSLGDLFASPGAVLHRLQLRATSCGAAREDVVTRRGHVRLAVHGIATDRFLWRLEDMTERATGGRGAEGLSLPMLTASKSGTVLFMNEAMRRVTGGRVKTIDRIFPELPIRSGEENLISAAGGTVRALAAEIEGAGGRREIYLLPAAEGLTTAGAQAPADFEDIPVALVRLTADGKVERANRLARDLLGEEPAERAQLSDLVEGLGRSVGEWLADALAGRISPRPEVLRATRHDRELFLQVTLARVVESGRPGLVAVLHDATEMKTLEAQFVQSQKMQAIGQLAGGVAHDFNNLLTAISGHCDLLLLRHDKGDGDYSDLVQIHQNANRAASLVGQLLAFSRKQNLQPKLLDMRDTLADLTHLLNRLVGEKVFLTLSHDPALKQVRADRRQLEQVLMNLVVNARDAMPQGGGIRIETENRVLTQELRRDRAAVPPGEYVVVRVVDEGTGIPADRLNKIFEPFYTTKRTGEGTGLGLSTAYGIVKQTGGFIFVDSVVGSGTTFSLWFPAHELQAQPEPQPEAKVERRAPRQGEGVVLLVEDEAPVRAFAARALRLRGYTVHEAENAEEALAMLSDPGLAIDVFVTDVIMPGMDGPSWVREALKDRPNVHTVFVSGYAEDSLADAQTRIPNSVFLPKPFSLSELTATVQGQIH